MLDHVRSTLESVRVDTFRWGNDDPKHPTLFKDIFRSLCELEQLTEVSIHYHGDRCEPDVERTDWNGPLMTFAAQTSSIRRFDFAKSLCSPVPLISTLDHRRHPLGFHPRDERSRSTSSSSSCAIGFFLSISPPAPSRILAPASSPRASSCSYRTTALASSFSRYP